MQEAVRAGSPRYPRDASRKSPAQRRCRRSRTPRRKAGLQGRTSSGHSAPEAMPGKVPGPHHRYGSKMLRPVHAPRPMLALTQLSNYLTLKGSFSALSKPNFTSNYALERSRRDLLSALLCTVLVESVWVKKDTVL